ncbi:hypothetical protein [Mycolicibacterium sarraceniae]|uniref:Uncharacterized protein n=1 Tax=Mycolicibacterium sarraceniae TaxID=1534348 RepID=A0A7I7ST24_9MYCO|nr:hypothetical protein [Mycolicibacterium sarraceniae]BBY60152.1 hypothetical protein MSAR_32880 [Mycolicibacterium sarraceniae]
MSELTEDSHGRSERANQLIRAATVEGGYKIIRDPETGKAIERVPDPVRAPWWPRLPAGLTHNHGEHPHNSPRPPRPRSLHTSDTRTTRNVTDPRS